jgi:hypothetical protein
MVVWGVLLWVLLRLLLRGYALWVERNLDLSGCAWIDDEDMNFLKVFE